MRYGFFIICFLVLMITAPLSGSMLNVIYKLLFITVLSSGQMKYNSGMRQLTFLAQIYYVLPLKPSTTQTSVYNKSFGLEAIFIFSF